jgi:tetratricopeptide (TPR) repeat protein
VATPAPTAKPAVPNTDKPSKRPNPVAKFLMKLFHSIASFFKFLFSKIKNLYKKHLLIAIISTVVIVALIVTGVVLVIKHNNDELTAKTSSTIASQYKDRLPALQKEVNSKPNDATAHKDYAVALYATGNLQEAVNQYSDAISINKDDATAYNNLGNAYRDLKQYDNAVTAYKKAISLNKSAINPYVNLANVQLYNLNKADDAVSTYKDALKALPNNTEIELLLGITYERKGDTSSAKATYNTILSQDSKNVAAKARLSALNK